MKVSPQLRSKITGLLHEAIEKSSLLWTNPTEAGVYQRDRAVVLLERVSEQIMNEIEKDSE